MDRVNEMKREIGEYKHLRRAKVAGKIFMDAAIKSATNADTITVATTTGLVQGLKYRGSLKRGIEGCVGTMIVLGVANGLLSVGTNWEVIKRA